MSRTLVVGIDAGATATRCVVATPDGEVVGRGTAGGANRNSSGGDVAETLGAALRAALPAVDVAAVRLGVVGGAGSAGPAREAFRAAARRAWAGAGLTGAVVTVTDLELAFVAGTAGPDGVLLLSGTGALAARFTAGTLERRCDGYGWLFGDEGSAVWMGVRALRAVLAALDGRGVPTALLEVACRHLAVVSPGAPGTLTREQREDLAQLLLTAGFARPPAALGGLAPAVSTAADAGDTVAQRICAAASAKLLHTFDTVGPPGGAVVVAGSVLLSPGPVARTVRAGIVARSGVAPREAVDGAGGAAVLAVARLTGGAVPATVHARLTGHRPDRQSGR